VKPFAKRLLIWSSVATGITGLVYFWMDRMLEPISEFAAINHPLQPLVLKAHILVAPLLVFALGIIGLDHIWKYLRGTMHRARRSGVAGTWMIVPMVATGYLIQAVTAPLWLEVLGWTHVATGVVYLGALAVHQLVVRRLRLVSLELRLRAEGAHGDLSADAKEPRGASGEDGAEARVRQGSRTRARRAGAAEPAPSGPALPRA
jgi:hypothetical protein